ncbi:hypothetical protein ICJ04_17430 [Stenotrophomonas sp. 169]|uniref:DUF6531 domain-containing protein n=1 Tax=Stenotrophomonas sp. 169 TaxID=2770322 RepID=UPI001662440E|nr:DUF6531 domain-containing protein [Stenotrophomonas sp. 169]QNR97228.1 hypothetical protein ICJ04_17430 [Stenotrophomonas sp. 169]
MARTPNRTGFYRGLMLAPFFWHFSAAALDPSKEKKPEDPRVEVWAKRWGETYTPGLSHRMERGIGAPLAARLARTAKSQETDHRKGCDGDGETGGNPVVLYTGNKVEHELDFSSVGEMGLFLARTYNHHWSATGIFGNHWLSNFDLSLVPSQNGDVLWAQRTDGRRVRYLRDAASGQWFEDKAQPISYIVRNPDGGYRLLLLSWRPR